MQRKASARWQGTAKEGSGTITTQSATLKDTPYSFVARFGDGKGTNPEELIAAAHAGCFTMALSFMLNNAGFTASAIDTEAALTMDQVGGNWTITAIHLTTRANVAGHRRREVRRGRRQRQGELPGLARPECDHHHGRKAVELTSALRSTCIVKPRTPPVDESMPPRTPPRDPLRRAPAGDALHGRGATFNPGNRFRRDAREAVDDGWAPLPGRRRRQPTRAAEDDGDDSACAHDHRPQRFAGHSVHAVDQSLSGLRARLRLLLRAADARLPRPLAGTRFRDQAVRQAGCGGAAERRTGETGLRMRRHRAGHQHRSVPADRARVEDHAADHRTARGVQPSAHHRHQVGAGRARHRPARAACREEHDARLFLDHDARSRAGAQAGAARRRRRSDDSLR